LEAVVVRWMVRARNHDAAVEAERTHREIQHRRRTEPDAQHLETAGHEAFDDRGFHFRRRQPAVIADSHALAAVANHRGAEAAADRARVGGGQRLADDAADVVLAQNSLVEAVCCTHSAALAFAAGRTLGTGRPMPTYLNPARTMSAG